MKRLSLSIRFLLLFTVSLLTTAIIWLASNKLYYEWQKLQDVKMLLSSTYTSEKMFNAIEGLSRERDIAASMLSASNNSIITEFQNQLAGIRQNTDSDLHDISSQLEKYEVVKKLEELRQQVDTNIKTGSNEKAVKDWIESSNKLSMELHDIWMRFTADFTSIDPVATQQILFTHFLGSIMEYSGRTRTLIGSIIAANKTIKDEERAKLIKWHNILQYAWSLEEKLASRNGLAPDITPYITDAQSHYANLYDMVKNTFYMENQGQENYLMGTDFWLELSSQATDSLYDLKQATLAKTREHVEALKMQALRSIVINFCVLFAAISLCIYSFFIINRRVIDPIEEIVDALVDTMANKPTAISPNLSNREDEIGKLAKVMHAFQENVEIVKKTSAKLERYVHDLERSNKELDDFAYIASHDLKEPLRGIHNHSRFLLEDNQDKLDEDSVNKLNRLVHLSQRMEDLVNDLLYFSRLGRQEMAIQKTSVNDVIADIKETIDLFLNENNAEIKVQNKIPEITCDTVRFTEVLRNLITNAVKYNDNDKKIVEIGFMPFCQDNENKTAHNVITVKDNGVGIAPEFYNEIFRIFKRLQSSKTGQKEGTGVGLTFVKKIIERHGGRIWLTSEIGKGTTFYFTLED